MVDKIWFVETRVQVALACGLEVVGVMVDEEGAGLSIVGVALVSSLTATHFRAAGSLASPIVEQCIRPPTCYVSSNETADQLYCSPSKPAQSVQQIDVES